jgi:hypothetical protein
MASASGRGFGGRTAPFPERMVDQLPVLNWGPWTRGAPEWDAMLSKLPGSGFTQAYGYGEHKKRSGWNVVRIAAWAGDDRIVAMAQVLVKRYPLGVILAWTPGGPVGAEEPWCPSFREAIMQVTQARLAYLRLNLLRPREEADSQSLLAAGWTRPRHPMLSGRSIVLDLAPPPEQWLRTTEANHRYRMRKSAAAALKWSHGASPDLVADFATLCAALSREKRIPMPDTDLADIQDLCEWMGGSVLIMVGYLGSEPVSGCLVLVREKSAFYAFAATVAAGRAVSAAYSMMSELRDILRRQGIQSLDLAGVNPDSESGRGVYHFKRGFGGSPIEYLGEWEWSSSRLLGLLANMLIARRMRAGTT